MLRYFISYHIFGSHDNWVKQEILVDDDNSAVFNTNHLSAFIETMRRKLADVNCVKAEDIDSTVNTYSTFSHQHLVKFKFQTVFGLLWEREYLVCVDLIEVVLKRRQEIKP